MKKDNEQYAPLKIALAAKEAGFNVEMTTFWRNDTIKRIDTGPEYMSQDGLAVSNWNDGNGSYPTLANEVLCSAPTLNELVLWLETKGAYVTAEPKFDPSNDANIWFKALYIAPKWGIYDSAIFMRYSTRSEALAEIIEYVLSLLKNPANFTNQ